YTWMVPHNVAGLVAALGGPERANARLDDFFHHADGRWALSRAGGTKSALDNEPSLNAPWLYNYTGQPHKTQRTVREVVNSLWTTGPGGIPGNDDLGAMSSWFVFAAIGLYPQVPSRAELVVGSPLFTSVRINRGGGRDIAITAPGASPRAAYVRGLEVNGRASTRTWLPESFVERGGRLAFTLGEEPDTGWGAAPGDAPPSFREGERPVRHDQPYHLEVEPGDPVVAPGATLPARVVSTKLYEGDPAATYTVTGPPALTFDPPSGAVPGGFSITAAPGAPQGFYPATVVVSVEGADPVVLPLVVNVAPEGSMPAAVNNTGTSDDETGDGDFDGGGYSYSRQALAAAGLAPGGTGSVDGLAFRWPDSPAGRPDNAVADGQRLDVTGTRLAFIGAATNGARAGTATVTFTDGSTAGVELGFSDWTLGGGGSTPSYGNAVVATTPYRNQSGGGGEEVATHIFATKTYTAPEGKVLRSVTLPTDDDLHVFAVAVASNS
ncbi:glycoside hydrolase domain-containing protein, partial [Actinosynnema sp. NPDC059797]